MIYLLRSLANVSEWSKGGSTTFENMLGFVSLSFLTAKKGDDLPP